MSNPATVRRAVANACEESPLLNRKRSDYHDWGCVSDPCGRETQGVCGVFIGPRVGRVATPWAQKPLVLSQMHLWQLFYEPACMLEADSVRTISSSVKFAVRSWPGLRPGTSIQNTLADEAADPANQVMPSADNHGSLPGEHRRHGEVSRRCHSVTCQSGQPRTVRPSNSLTR